MEKNMYYGAGVVIFENAKRLRKNMTIAENLLWEWLSNNQLQVKFRPQHPVANYVVDFYCHKAKLVIEIDGEVHYSESQQKEDELRQKELEQFELKVIRFTNEQVFTGIENVIQQIQTALRNRIITRGC